MNQKLNPKNIALRLAELPDDKKTQFRALLKDKNIDSWQLPIVATPRVNGKEVLSNAQQRLWFIDHYEQGSSIYNLFSQIQLIGQLDIEALKYALNALITRHEVLRTTYHIEDDAIEGTFKPNQRPNASFELPLWVESDVKDIDKRSQEVANAVFDLSTELPLRVYLLKEKEQHWRLVFVVHHIAFDAWSEAILIKELANYYQQYLNATNQGATLPKVVPLELQYADYAKWQQEWLESEQAEQQLAFWQQTLAGSPECISLPLDRQRPDVISRTYEGGEVQLTIPTQTFMGLNALAKEQGTTLYSVMQAGFSLLLNQYGAGSDISLGTSVASRQRPELEGMIGFLVNTLVIRHQLQDRVSFRELIDQVSITSRQAFENQAVPFDLVVDTLNIPRGKPWTPLFQVLFVHQNVPRQTIELGGVAVSPVASERHRARFDLTLRLNETEQALRLDMEYSKELFDEATIVEMLESYLVLLEDLVANPDQVIALCAEHDCCDVTAQPVTRHVDSDVIDSVTEKLLIALFTEILDVEVRPEDSFFELGGDSILSLQLVAKAKKHSLSLSPKLLFKAQTPRAIAQQLIEHDSTSQVEPKAASLMSELSHLNTILSAFKQLLNNPALTENDSFFELGGDSILSLQLVALLKKQGVKVSPKQVFALQTSKALAMALIEGDSAANDQNHKTQGNGALEADKPALAPIQHWFFEQALEQPSHWNQSILLQHEGELETEAFTQAVRHVVANHPQLGMAYNLEEDKQNWQKSFSQSPIVIDRHTLSLQELPDYLEQQQARLDIFEGTMLRVDLLVIEGQPHGRILFTAHHLAVDAVSWRILASQIWQAYQALCSGAPLHDGLELSSSSYEAWVSDLSHWPKENLSNARDYWQALEQVDLETKEKWTAIPGVDPETPLFNQIKDTDVVEVRLSADLSHKLASKALSAYQLKVDELMLSAVSLAIQEWRGQDDFLIELESHGRHHDSLDLSQTVGWFTSRYPVLLASSAFVESQDALRQHVLAIKDQLRNVPNHGQGFGVLKYLHKELQRVPTPAMVFNYLGQTDKGMINSGLGLAKETIPKQRHGDNTRPHWLDLNAMITDGELVMRWNFNNKVHSKSQIEAVAEMVVEKLTLLVEHCCHARSTLSPTDVPLCNMSQSQLDKVVDSIPHSIENIADIYPVTPLQNGMLYHTLTDHSEGMYINQSLVDLNGALNVTALELAWQWVIDQHAMLRSGFVWKHLDDPVQFVAREISNDWQFIDWSEQAIGDTSSSNLDAQLAQLASDDLKQGFDLTNAGLMRFKLVKMSNDHHSLVWTRHHLIVDGWCTSIILRDVQQAYSAICKHTQPALISNRPYRDFIAWLNKRDAQKSEQYWATCFAGYENVARLPKTMTQEASGPVARSQTQILDSLSIFDAEVLRNVAAKHRLTLNSLCQAIWALTLQRYTGCNDLAFGVTSSGRPNDLLGADEMVGVFITTIPLRANIDPSTSWVSLAQKLQSQMAESREHEHLPLSTIQRVCGQQLEVFDNLLVFENYPNEPQPLDEELTLSVRETKERNNYPLTLVVVPHQQLDFRIEINPEHIDFSVAQNMLADFKSLLVLISQAQESSDDKQSCGSLLRQISMGGEHFAPWAWNKTETSFDEIPETLVQWLEDQARRTPDRVALVYETSEGICEYSYNELNQKASQLAHYLLDRHECKTDQTVAVCMTRSPQMVVSLLGILKAGCAYLPLDPDLPADRLGFIAENAQAKVVLTIESCKSALPAKEQARAILLDESVSLCQTYPDVTPNVELKGDHLAYVLYTSGSTGKPKGVAIPHAGIVNRLAWMQAQYKLTDADTVLQKTPYSFDVSVWEFFWPLVTGAKLVLAKANEHKDTDRLISLIQQHQVTTIHFVPSMLQSFLDNPNAQACSALSRIICSGEALPYQLQQQCLHTLQAELHNLYGPTEASIDVTYWDCRNQNIQGVVPIGYPIANMQTWILDSSLNPVPVGVEGELYLAGVGLARGYLGREDLTKQVFIPNPFADCNASSDVEYARLYRTGDVARYREDGAIEYVGRSDFQVKIRGLRIELGEIDASIAAHHGVKEVVTIVRQNASSGDYLATYIIPQPDYVGQLGEPNIWRDYLSGTLPEYMIPAVVTELDKMPVTQNGKLDRKSLPEPTWHTQAFVAPETETEQTLAEIWQALLDVKEVSKTDNFFSLGGHSLLITRLVNRVNQTYGLSIRLTDVLEMSVLEQQAGYIEMLMHQAESATEVDEEWESFEL